MENGDASDGTSASIKNMQRGPMLTPMTSACNEVKLSIPRVIWDAFYSERACAVQDNYCCRRGIKNHKIQQTMD